MEESNTDLTGNLGEMDQAIRKLVFLNDKNSEAITSLMEDVNWDALIDNTVKEYGKKSENFIHHLKNEGERISNKINETTPEDIQEVSNKINKKIDHLTKNFNKEIEDYVNGDDVKLKVDGAKSDAYVKKLEAEARFKASLAQMGESFRAWKDALELKMKDKRED